jgi:hypothetical protein
VEAKGDLLAVHVRVRAGRGGEAVVERVRDRDARVLKAEAREERVGCRGERWRWGWVGLGCILGFKVYC